MGKRIGACHCKAVEFEIDFGGDFEKVRRCDCSFCSKRWAVVANVPVSGLQVIKGKDKLSLYQWGTNTARHYFCSVCGIYTHHQRRSNPSEYGVNIACFDEVNVRDYMDTPYSDGVNHPSDRADKP
jgi:hypothetical protein